MIYFILLQSLLENAAMGGDLLYEKDVSQLSKYLIL